MRYTIDDTEKIETHEYRINEENWVKVCFYKDALVVYYYLCFSGMNDFDLTREEAQEYLTCGVKVFEQMMEAALEMGDSLLE